MIGTNVRGLRHLWRLSDSSLKEVLINFRDYGYCFCHVFKTKSDSPFGERLVIFNTHYNWGKKPINEFLNSTFLSDNEIKYVAQNYSRVIEFTSQRQREEFPYIYVVNPQDYGLERNVRTDG